MSKFSKLEFEVIDLGPGKDMGVKITLDGKSVVMERLSAGAHQVPINDLPDYTVGRGFIEEAWDLGISLLKCSEIAEGDMWREVDEETMQEVWDVCT